MRLLRLLLVLTLCAASSGCLFSPDLYDIVPSGYTGVRRTYHGGGLESEINWLRGRKHGRAILWYYNGDVLMVETFKRGRLHGKHTAWHTGGEKWSEVVYVEGKKEGRELKWSADGTVEADGIWKNGKPWQGHIYENFQDRFYKDGVEITHRQFLWNKASESEEPASP